MLKKLLLFTVVSCISLTLAYAATDVAAALKGSLVRVAAGQVVPTDSGKLGDIKYYALYYSAHWCPPCRAFTPKLVEFYNEFKPKHPDFELVFFSDDRSAADMNTYMKETNMPWPAVAFDKVRSHALAKYSGPGIPCLVLVDSEGKVLSDSFAGSRYLGPQHVVEDIKRLVK